MRQPPHLLVVRDITGAERPSRPDYLTLLTARYQGVCLLHIHLISCKAFFHESLSPYPSQPMLDLDLVGA